MKSNETILEFTSFAANKIKCQSVICHFGLRFDDHLRTFGHGISRGGKVGGVQCYPQFFQLLLQFINIAGSRFWNLVFSKFWKFFLEFRSGELQGKQKRGCYGCLEILSRFSSRELGHHHV